MPLKTRDVRIEDLKPHPRNYKTHPQDQLDHLKASLDQYGQFRPVTLSEDGYIITGHGLVEAMEQRGDTMVAVFDTPFHHLDPKALKLMALDNEVGHRAEVDSRALSVLLKEVNEADTLDGTGFDEVMLANLVMVTRPASEIADFDAAAHWVGLPEYEEGETALRISIQCNTEEERQEALRHSAQTQRRG